MECNGPFLFKVWCLGLRLFCLGFRVAAVQADGLGQQCVVQMASLPPFACRPMLSHVLVSSFATEAARCPPGFGRDQVAQRVPGSCHISLNHPTGEKLELSLPLSDSLSSA